MKCRRHDSPLAPHFSAGFSASDVHQVPKVRQIDMKNRNGFRGRDDPRSSAIPGAHAERFCRPVGTQSIEVGGSVPRLERRGWVQHVPAGRKPGHGTQPQTQIASEHGAKTGRTPGHLQTCLPVISATPPRLSLARSRNKSAAMKYLSTSRLNVASGLVPILFGTEFALSRVQRCRRQLQSH